MSAMPTYRIRGLQVGMPSVRTMTSGRKVTTGFWKEPVEGQRWLSSTKVDGDGQGDLESHGGVDKALLAYPSAHYPTWAAELGQPFPFGAFGENVTVDGLDEWQVCIGDVWQLGDAVTEVSQPRQPCWKIDFRWGRRDLTKLVERTGRTGWYHRVLTPGQIGAGDALRLVDRPNPTWTVTRAAAIIRRPGSRPEESTELAELNTLSIDLRDWLTEWI